MRYAGLAGSSSDYGMQLVKRTPATLQLYGPSYRAANPTQQQARRANAYFGQGEYDFQPMLTNAGSQAGKYLGQIAGRQIGGIAEDIAPWVAQRAGAALGSKLGAYANSRLGDLHFVGAGEYTSNALVNGGGGGSGTDIVPRFGGDMDGASVVISHREYVTDVYGPAVGTSFANQAYQLNPGLETTFPWLSQIAQNYDEYTLRQCIWTFRSTVTDIGSSTNGQCGTIIMATNYNAAAEPFADKQTMMEYDSSMSGKTTEHMLHGVECDPSKLSGNVGRYVRTAPVQVGQDIKTYDHAQLNVALTNVPAGYANQSIGELWVSYTVELRKPRFFVSRGLGISRDTWAISGNSTPALPLIPKPGLGGQLLGGQQNSLGTWLSETQNTIYFPGGYAGNIKLRFIVGLPINAPPSNLWAFSYTGNIAAINDIPYSFYNGTQWNNQGFTDINQTYTSASGGGQYQIMVVEHHVRIGVAGNGVENTISFNPQSTSTFSAWCALDIEEYNTNLCAKQNGLNDDIVYVDSGGTVVPF